MDTSPNLILPYIIAAQAQKHVTHNEAIRALDAVVQLAVLDKDLATPPGSPADGARYIVAASPTGAWAGHAGKIAAWQDGVWQLYTPREGWLAWVADEDKIYVYGSSAWAEITVSVGSGASIWGVNATADTTNRLAVKSAASLFDNVGNGHQLKVNKAAAGDTASHLFQTGYSGRAEFGLAGDDDYHVKVSPDGSSWYEAMVADRATGKVRFPNTPGREVLAAARTYYVRADGNDANTGLADNAGGAFLTIQKAVDTVAGLDLSIYDVTIQVRVGTYTAAVTLKTIVGAGSVIIIGDETTPANVVVSTTSAHCFSGDGARALYKVRGLRLKTATSGHGISLLSAGIKVEIQNLDFNGIANDCLFAGYGADITATGPLTVSGNAGRLANAAQAHIRLASQTVTLTGTPAWASQGVQALRCALVEIQSVTFSGAATGTRYLADSNAVIYTGGGGANFIPGNAAGSTATGGQYI